MSVRCDAHVVGCLVRELRAASHHQRPRHDACVRSDGKAADMDQRPVEEWESEFLRVTKPGRRHKLEANPPAATVRD